MLSEVEKQVLKAISNDHSIPQVAYNLRKNGEGADRSSDEEITINTKKDKPGIDVFVKPGTKNKSVHIPVIISKTGITDMVYNSFDIGEDSDVLIVAGCGIHNPGDDKSQHDGIHEFLVRKNAHMKYTEKHYGQGEGMGKRILNPKTILEVFEGGSVEMELIQIKGVDNTIRETEVTLHEGASLIVTERLFTDYNQKAESHINIRLLGENSSAQIISRSVARGKSEQTYYFNMIGENKCAGHIQCDAIIMDGAKITSLPAISAFHQDAQLIHEAEIGRISSEQLIKLMSLGLSEKEAEDKILEGFLK
ncbi:SufD family Fe-S cluster assembly protein [Clostridium sp.]|uniref:SufB/SufD family protein n=1 Tax=Clostridium sp. TaxID=1506 RepID=UPI001A54A1BB|nr:SufD family Fe-S cluster assembly protein [Clostridium sp.]MBK5241089.1 SufD family Fe-S cluster assembly protein [Clostridium sp.]